MTMRWALWTCATLAPQAHAAGPDLAAGQAAYAKCASCHAVGKYARGGFAPQLNGIVGRRAGSTSDFAYSSAMKNANIVWTEQNLSAFLRAPGNVVPGNKMRFWGIGDEKQRSDLIAYMKTFAPISAGK